MPANPPATAGAATINYMTQMSAGEWRASKLKGVNVYNTANEKIGDINEILLDNSGKVHAVVIGVGGFLGMGEHDVAVAFSDLKPVSEAVRTSSTSTTAPASNTAANTAAPRTSNDVTGTTAAMNDRGYPDHFLLNATKDQLKAAPQFKYSTNAAR
jgi:sporulation protein YlmC with PRC-barrel domain